MTVRPDRAASSAAARIAVTNRTAERARRLAASVSGSTAGFGDLPAALADADLVISCTGAAGLVIPAEMTASVFERFTHGNRASRRGAGLGLAIVKAISEGHGGTVMVRQREEGGTVFEMRLPYAPPDAITSTSDPVGMSPPDNAPPASVTLVPGQPEAAQPEPRR